MSRDVIRILSVVLLAASVGLVGCKKKGASQNNPPSMTFEQAVYTTFYPTTYFAEQIAGDTIPVVCPLPDDEDPIFWQPSRETIARYQNAALIVVNGASFEKWVEAVSLPENRIVDTAAAFSDSFIQYETTTHRHGAGGEHMHEGVDGHTWVDPVLAMAQAEAIKDAMVRTFPDHASTFEENYRVLATDLKALDDAFKAITTRLEGVTLLASHPAYNYVTARYGWTVRNFDLDPDAESLGEEQFQELVAAAGERTILLWEGEPTELMLRPLRDGAGIQSVLFSPCETPDAQAGDYLARMKANLERLRVALGEDG